MSSSKKKNFKNPENQEIFKVCNNLFGHTLHSEIITSVAKSQKWDLHKTIQILEEMTRSVPNSVNHTLGLNSISYNAKDDDADVVVEGNNRPNQPSMAYNKVTAKKPHNLPKNNVPSLNTGAKKKQTTSNGPKIKSKKDIEIERVRGEILKGHQVLIILRGLPGSGKSHLAKYLASSTVPGDFRTYVFSTDDYFVTGGVYRHNPALLAEAHAWNQRRVFEAAQIGLSPIIIDNTNTQAWEMRPYSMTAVQFGYQLEILEPNTPWSNHVHQLTQKNIHNVPKQKINEMQLRYEQLTVNQLFSMFCLQYAPNKIPPQMRKHPFIRSKTANKPTQGTVQGQVRPTQKQKKQRKRPRPQPVNQSSIKTDSESVTNSESQDQLSDAWESDNDGTWEEISQDPVQNNFQLDFLTNDSEYVLVKNKVMEPQVQDLINFNDFEHKESNSNLINTSQNQNEINYQENSPTRRISLLDQEITQETKSPDNFEDIKIDNVESTTEIGAMDYTKKLLSSFQQNWNLFNAPISTMFGRNSDNTINKIESKKISTSTVSTDFFEMGKINPGDKILFGTPRTISDLCCATVHRVPPKILMLEKGTMTSLENMETSNMPDSKSNDLRTLLNLFPQVDEDVLQDIFDKCQGNVNWAVDLLLENGSQANSTGEGERKPKEIKQEVNDMSASFSKMEIDNLEEENATAEIVPKINKLKNKFIDDPLKKHIEQQFKIGDEYYSEHVLNLRKKRYNIPDTSFGESSASKSNISVQTQQEPEYDSEIDEVESEEIVELNFGREFIEQLEKEFENTNTEYLDGLLPVMQVPASLVRQLHALWMESVYSQMEMQSNLMQEIERQDAEMAKRLQDEEARALQTQQTPQEAPSLLEIMDMEIALAIYRADKDQWRRETPDDLASKMTRQKLFEAFPQQNKDVLCEILQAHDNCFEETVQTLLSSIGRTENEKLANVNGKIVAINPLDQVAKQKQLLEKAKNDLKSFQIANHSDLTQNDNDNDSDDEIEICKRGANYYRERAAHHLDMRQKLFQKANDCIKKGQHQVASYYSEVAKLHIQKYEIENNRAACAFLSEHSLGHRNEKILDLHYLYVKEAEEALAMFLDGQISRLRQLNRPNEVLFIITGRGKNSTRGKAQIKPAVKKRLKERRLKFSEMNPGSLKIIINKHSPLTNDLKSTY